MAGCDLDSDGTDDIIARDVPRCRHRSAPSSPSTRVSAVGVRVAGCDVNGDGTDEIIVITS